MIVACCARFRGGAGRRNPQVYIGRDLWNDRRCDAFRSRRWRLGTLANRDTKSVMGDTLSGMHTRS